MDAIILCGGAGTRLWPLSKRGREKHFLSVTGDRSLVQEAYGRLAPISERVWAVAPPEQRDLLQEQLPEIPEERLVPEPAARGTAAAIGLAIWAIARRDPEAVIGSFHADHLIGDADHFRRDVQRAVEVATREERIVLLGLKPTYASTGFGYIKLGEELAHSGHAVGSYEEKPDEATAKRYLAAGEYLWNLGMFIAPARVFQAEFEKHLPGVGEVLEATLDGEDDRYLSFAGESIDTAVIEKSDRVAVLPVDFPWSDVGSFADLYDSLLTEAGGNVEVGEVQSIDASGNLFFSSGRLIAAIGVHDLAVIETPEAVLVCPREKSQEVKRLVERIREAGK